MNKTEQEMKLAAWALRARLIGMKCTLQEINDAVAIFLLLSSAA